MSEVFNGNIRRLKALKYLVIGSLLLFVFIVGSFVAGYVLIEYKISTPADKNGELQLFTVEEGEGIKEIADNLLSENIISSDFFFETYVWLKGGRSIVLQAGEYHLSPKMNIVEVVNMLSGGEVVSSDVWVTIPEGFSLDKIDARLAKNELIKSGEFKAAAKSLNFDYDFLAGSGASLEGYLFPDTYKFEKDIEANNIIIKMLDNFDNKLSEQLRYEIKKQGRNINDVIILASIIQNEVSRVEDMRKVSSIFQNRLEIGQALQSDATINYATGGNRPAPTYEDLEVESPYNTYKYAGLPPGPISNPGIDAIEAAIYPEKTDYFYFLNPQDGSGATIFSKTLEEHNANKAKYLKN